METYTKNRKSNDDLENAMLECFHSKRSNEVLINGAMIMQKAKEIKTDSINEKFSASKG